MSFQKSSELSLSKKERKIKRKTLKKCSLISCYECYRKNPNGFYCPPWTIIHIPFKKLKEIK